MVTPSELSLLTVSYRSEALIARNLGQILKLNPGVGATWIIVNHEPRSLSLGRATDAIDVKIIEGPAPQQREHQGSYHHAHGLNLGLRQVRSRFLAVIDPDFFVLRPNWIREITLHMKERGLTFFGAPWDPSNPTKYRGFPCVHFLVVDLEKVPAARLDFTPDLDHSQKRRRFADALVNWKKGLPGSRKVLWPLDLARHALLKGYARDTGYPIYDCFQRSPKECLTFAWGKEQEATRSAVLAPFPAPVRRLLGQGGEEHTPGFLADDESCDQFLWKGDPFAFHLRRMARASRGMEYGSEAADLKLWERLLASSPT